MNYAINPELCLHNTAGICGADQERSILTMNSAINPEPCLHNTAGICGADDSVGDAGDKTATV
jgi:hypothetical protein